MRLLRSDAEGYYLLRKRAGPSPEVDMACRAHGSKVMQKRRVFGVLTIAAAVGVLGFGAESAQAVGTIQSLAVGACQWEAGGTPVYDWKGIYNSGSSAMTVECGVPNNDDLQSATNWSVHIDDQHSSLNGKCRFRMMDLWGNTIATSAQKNTTSVGSGQGLFWDWNEPTRTDPSGFGAIDGVTYVSCSIPGVQNGKRSGLNGVFVQKQF